METMFTSTPPSERETNNEQTAFRLISLLLQYPHEEWWQLDELFEAADEIESSAVKEQISRFLAEMKERSLDELGESYVNTFDFNAKTSLYLTYSELGEERERGQILVQLKDIYEAAGLLVESAELPDYLPMFLEFVSLAPQELAQDMLGQYRSAIEQLGAELGLLNSPYKRLIDACLIAAAEFSNIA